MAYFVRKLIEWQNALEKINFDFNVKKECLNELDTTKAIRHFSKTGKVNNLDELCHELSPHVKDHKLYQPYRTLNECKWFKYYFGVKTFSIDFFIDLVSQVNQKNGRIRDYDFGLNAESINGSVIFPSHIQAKKRLFEIIEIANKSSIGCFKTALLVYVLLLNAHPFTDGNGRIARMMFNFLMCKSEKQYLPIYEFQSRSSGGHEIRLRQAEILNQWQPLIYYFINCYKICRKY